ncbi:MAG TPA: GNAT family N-acetyltransferase [Sphingomonas sp.]|jgi:hypothetical protein|uniref:GNAT family N-acetyltransferase n=1 Tax=Sphingomonas sp. TaxID=28214 RepID=UPI002EDAFEC1
MIGTWAERCDAAGLPPAITAAWDMLAIRAATPNIFYERWMVAPSAALAATGPPDLLLVWHGPVGDRTRLIGLLPLQPGRMAGRYSPALLQNWEQPVRALGDPLVLAGHERDFWIAALAHLDRHGSGAYLRLSTLAADGSVTAALLALLAERRRPWAVTRRTVRAILRHGPTSAAYRAAHIRKKVLKEQRRLLNRLGEHGELSVDRLADDADPARWIDALFALELGGWKGRDGVAAAADPVRERSFRQILTTAHALGRLDFRRLALDGAPLAMLATIETPQGHAFQLKIAYDENYAAFSPGVLLEMACLDVMLDEGRLDLVDSCARAGHPMIDRIWVERRDIISLTLPFDRPLSRLLHAGRALAVRAAARRRAIRTER